LRTLEGRLRAAGRPDLVQRAVKLADMARSLLTESERNLLDSDVAFDHHGGLSDEALAAIVVCEDAVSLADGLREAAKAIAAAPKRASFRMWGDA